MSLASKRSLALWVGFCASLLPVVAFADAPPGWRPELSPAFDLYNSGAFNEAGKLAEKIGQRSRDELRRDADALAALCLMRADGREERLTGRTQLAKLSERDTQLLTRPECLLAGGIAATGLSETSTAIRLLIEARTAFAARHDARGAGDALFALAQAWAVHSEWEVAIPGYSGRRPETVTDADSIRRLQITRLIQEATESGQSAEIIARIKLILFRIAARDALVANGPDNIDEELARIADDDTANAARFEAALLAGERLEQRGDWDQAAQRYAQASNSEDAKIADEARRRLADMSVAEIDLPLPHGVEGDIYSIALRARNVEGVELEARRIDLASWLSETRGALREEAPPTAGSVIATKRFTAPANASHAWWNAVDGANVPRIEAPPGAYALIARATRAGAAPLVATRLFVSGGLRVGMVAGANRGIVWVSSSDPAVSAAARSARLWIAGAAKPLEIELRDGVGQFLWPGEARISTRPWICWGEASEYVGFCRGVTQPATIQAPAAGIIASPAFPRVGEALSIFGMVRSVGADGVTAPRGADIRVELLDALESLRLNPQTELLPGGAFLSRIAVQPAMAGKRLSGVVRVGERVATPLRGRFGALVDELDPSPMSVIARSPARLAPQDRLIPLGAFANDPWGPTPKECAATFVVHALRLPTNDDPRLFPAAPWTRRTETLYGGRAALLTPIQELTFDEEPRGPIALSITCGVTGADGRQSRGVSYSLIGDEHAGLWIEVDPPSPHVGDALNATIKWFDPQGLARPDELSLTCASPSAPPRSLTLSAGFGGIAAAPMRALSAGRYRFSATLPLSNGKSLEAHLATEVTDASNGAGIDMTAEIDPTDPNRIRVRLMGGSVMPTLVTLVSGEPLTAAIAPPFENEIDVTLSSSSRASEARIVAYQLDGDSSRQIAECALASSTQAALTVRILPSAKAAIPGGRWRFAAECVNRDTHGAVTLLARLVDAADSGCVQWLPGESLDIAYPSSFTPRVFGASGESEQGTTGVRVGGELTRGLFEGASLWLDARAANSGPVEFQAAIPNSSIRYRLIVMAIAEDGSIATASELIDLRAAPTLSLDAPATSIVGDRYLVSARVTNPVESPLQGTLRLEPGQGIALEAGVSTRGAGKATADQPGEVRIEIPAGGELIVRFRGEAASAGRGFMTAKFDSPSGQPTAEASYRVTAAETKTAGSRDETTKPAIRIRRQWFVLESELTPVDENEVSPTPSLKRSWLRRAPAAGERLPPGTPLLVQEDIECDASLRELVWRQTMPANAITAVREDFDVKALGALGERRLDRIEYRLPSLAAGRSVHEYLVITGRPGVCSFPSPEIRSGDETLTVEIIGVNPLIVDDSN